MRPPASTRAQTRLQPGCSACRTREIAAPANELMPEGAGAGAPLPFFVSQVDADGNETSGVRLPALAVPIATFTGWNFRNPAIGNTTELIPLVGSYIVFPRTRRDREQSGDPRRSIEERYASRDAYAQQVKAAAAALVTDGYLLADDVPAVVHQAEDAWDLVTRQ